ncbi:MAG: response regulator [Clostridia bacterium]|nr:response regulator [Clostridia bacterium]
MKDDKNTVLFVDDEENILRALKRGLNHENYIKFFATSGEAALKVIEQEEIDVIVTDMKMPGMDGLKLLREVMKLSPKTVRIVLSGYTQLPQVLLTINEAKVFKFITKPWDMETEFIGVIREALDYYNTYRENERLKAIVQKKSALYENLIRISDDRIKYMKQDIKNISSLIDTLSTYFFEKVQSDNQEQVVNAFKHFNESMTLVRKYLLYLPTVHKTFTFKMFLEDLVGNLAITEKIDKHELETFFDLKLDPEVYYIGDYFGMKYLLEVMLMCPRKSKERKPFKVAFTSLGEDLDHKTMLKFLAVVPEYCFESPQHLEVTMLIFNHLVSYIGESITVSKVDGSYLFTLLIQVVEKTSERKM